MKRIKIFTLIFLLLGFIAASAQQTNTDLQKSNSKPATEQLNPAERSAADPPVMSPETKSSALPAASSGSHLKDPGMKAERDASMPPTGEQKTSLQDESMQTTRAVQPEFQGQTAADPPDHEKPIK